jgi:hypothetical protein
MVLLSGTVILSVPLIDKFYLKYGLFEEIAPIFSTVQFLRSLTILISLSALTAGLINLSSSKLIFIEIINFQFEKAILYVAVFLAIIFGVIFLIEPRVFSSLSREDEIIEWGSMLLSLGGSIIFIASFLSTRKSQNIPAILKVTFLLFGFIFFLIAMEEISWFQRVLEFQTPSEFSNNAQNEFNFHNYATNLFENYYYFGSFLYFVVFPFVWRALYDESKSIYIKILLPQPYLILVCGIACAFNYDMWNVFLTQISFIGVVIVLFVLHIFCKKKPDKFFIAFILFLIIGIQIVFLANGNRFIRLWDVTEYKEFFIPLVFLGYGISVYRNATQACILE